MIGSSPLNYKHLQVFLHRKNESDCTNDYEYLMIGENQINLNLATTIFSL